MCCASVLLFIPTLLFSVHALCAKFHICKLHFEACIFSTVYAVSYCGLILLQADEESSTGDLNEEGMKTLQQQEEMFRNLDVQYEMARSQTHTQRGMGLGFSTSFSSRGMDPV